MGTRTKTNQGRDALTKLFLAEDINSGIRLNPLEVRQVNRLLRSAAVQRVQELQKSVDALQAQIETARAEQAQSEAAEAVLANEAGEEE